MSTDLPFLDSFTGQSTDELIGLQGLFRVDSIVLAFEEALSTKASPTSEESVVLAVEALEREVNNGGFSQFFVNSSRAFVPEIAGALIAIGCPGTAALANSAMAILGIDDSTSIGAIEDAACDATEEQDEKLGELDAIYYKGEEEPIADKLFEFIKRNRLSITTAAP